MNKNFWVAFIVALVLDGLDYVGGWLPIVGDVLDVFGVIVLYKLIGPVAVLGIAELVPALDFLPVFTGTVVISKLMEKRR